MGGRSPTVSDLLGAPFQALPSRTPYGVWATPAPPSCSPLQRCLVTALCRVGAPACQVAAGGRGLLMGVDLHFVRLVRRQGFLGKRLLRCRPLLLPGRHKQCQLCPARVMSAVAIAHPQAWAFPRPPPRQAASADALGSRCSTESGAPGKSVRQALPCAGTLACGGRPRACNDISDRPAPVRCWEEWKCSGRLARARPLVASRSRFAPRHATCHA